MSVNRRTYDPQLDIALGMVPGVSHVNKFGDNLVITTATDPEDIWDVGGIWIPPVVADGAQIHNIKSSSDDDALGGAGAEIIRIFGLDENWHEISELVEMNGGATGPGVDTANEYWRIYRMYVVQNAAGGSNVGNISATANISGTITAQIDIAIGQTLMAIYTVPAKKRAYLAGDPWASINRATGAVVAADMVLLTYGPTNVANGATRTRLEWGIESTGTTVSQLRRRPYESFPEMTDIILRVAAVSATCNISGGFDITLVDDPYIY